MQYPTVTIAYQPKAIYRLLPAGELLEDRDSVYRPGLDEWWQISWLDPKLVGTPYDPARLGPVRRFNK